MQNILKNIIILTAIVFLAAACNSGSVVREVSSSAGGQVEAASVSTSYTLAEVQSANSQQKCWTVINSNVYDLTSFIYRHPGGSQYILALCGTDGTAAFSAQHLGQRQPEQELSALKIGVVGN